MKRFSQYIANEEVLDEDGAAGGIGGMGAGSIANAAGTGGVAGLGVGPKGEPGVDNRPKKKKKLDEAEADAASGAARLAKLNARIHEERETFAGAPVFDVDSIAHIKGQKHPRHRYARYVGVDEAGEAIRQHGRSTKGDIVLKDSRTAVMTYLRRRPVK